MAGIDAHAAWAAVQERRCWPLLERSLGRLPLPLLGPAMLARHALAAKLAPSGQFADLLTEPGEDPILDLFAWAEAALPAPAQRRAAAHGFAWAGLSLMALAVREQAADPDEPAEPAAPALAEALDRLARRHMRRLLGAGAPWWREDGARIDSPRALHQAAWTALGHLAGRQDRLPALRDLARLLDGALQLRRDLRTLRRDLAHGRRSALIDGLGGGAANPAPATIMGALVFGPALPRLVGECQAALAQCRAAAEALGLPGFGPCFDAIGAAAAAWPAAFGLKPTAGPRQLPPMLAPGRERAVIRSMAERFLLADPELRESWEIQRQRLFGVEELRGIVFPSGSVLELLCRDGHELRSQVDGILAMLRANGAQYYEAMPVPAPDADDLGLALRLVPHASDPAAQLAALAGPLALMRRHIAPDGACDTWFMTDEVRAKASFFGNRCATVSAQLARGLLASGSGERELIDRLAGFVCAEIGRRGLAANQHYAPLYGLWILRLLLEEWQPVGEHGQRLRQRAGERLRGAFRRLAAQPPASPQDAALLVLVAALEPAPAAEMAGWRTLLERQQSYDGGWAAAPLYFSPGINGAVAWYASRLLTSAICYHALGPAGGK